MRLPILRRRTSRRSGEMMHGTSSSAQSGRRVRRGQSTVEMALVLPLIVLLLSVVIEAGLALNAWIRVSTAARDATRFALDAGRPADTASLVLNKLAGMDTTKIDVYIITGKTDDNGEIPNNSTYWSVNHRYGNGSAIPKVTRDTIQDRLEVQGQLTAYRNMPFTIVEVDFQYSPMLATLVARGLTIPMTSYAIVQQY